MEPPRARSVWLPHENEGLMLRRQTGLDGAVARSRRSVAPVRKTTVLAASLGALVGVGLAWVCLLLAVFEVWSTW